MKEEFRFLCAVLLGVILAGCEQVTFEAAPGAHPIKNFRITRRNTEVEEVFVRVDRNVRIDSLVDLSIFSGADYRMSLEEARKKFGRPQSRRRLLEWRNEVALYSVSKGELGFMSVPTSGGGVQHQVRAFPTNPAPALIFLNDSVRTQVVKILPPEKVVDVHISRDVVSGSVTLRMKGDRVESLVMGPRDGEAK